MLLHDPELFFKDFPKKFLQYYEETNLDEKFYVMDGFAKNRATCVLVIPTVGLLRGFFFFVFARQQGWTKVKSGGGEKKTSYLKKTCIKKKNMC